MAPANPSAAPAAQPSGATGVLVLADGTILWGVGYGASGAAVGEICFNTSMTGYQEILTDPSYAGQIVTFTFPHIGKDKDAGGARGLGRRRGRGVGRCHSTCSGRGAKRPTK